MKTSLTFDPTHTHTHLHMWPEKKRYYSSPSRVYFSLVFWLDYIWFDFSISDIYINIYIFEFFFFGIFFLIGIHFECWYDDEYCVTALLRVSRCCSCCLLFCVFAVIIIIYTWILLDNPSSFICHYLSSIIIYYKIIIKFDSPLLIN